MKFKSITKAVFTLTLLFSLNTRIFAQVSDPANDSHIESNVRDFLNVLNSGTGKPLEQLSPKDARGVLIGAQSSVKVDLSGVSVAEKTITQDGLTFKINIVKPINSKDILPCNPS